MPKKLPPLKKEVVDLPGAAKKPQRADTACPSYGSLKSAGVKPGADPVHTKPAKGPSAAHAERWETAQGG